MHINNIAIINTLIDMKVTFNLIRKDTMLKLKLEGSLRNNIILFQLANRSIIKLKEII